MSWPEVVLLLIHCVHKQFVHFFFLSKTNIVLIALKGVKALNHSPSSANYHQIVLMIFVELPLDVGGFHFCKYLIWASSSFIVTLKVPIDPMTCFMISSLELVLPNQ